MWRMCPPGVAQDSYSDHWPLYPVFTLMMGEMLDVARWGPHGGKLRLSCQGWYVCSTRTRQNLRFDCHLIGNSTANFKHDSMVGVCCMNAPGDSLRQTSPEVLCVEEYPVYIHHNRDFCCRSNQFMSVIKALTSDRVTVNCRTVRILCTLRLYAVGFMLRRMCKLAVIHSVLSWSQLYIPQDFPLLFVIILLTFSTTASHGSTYNSAMWESIPIELNDRHLIYFATCRHTAARKTPVHSLQRCQCRH